MPIGDECWVWVLNANYRAGRRLGMRFQAKTEGDVVRVWRIT